MHKNLKILLATWTVSSALAVQSFAADPLVIDRASYAEHLRGMWFGDSLANWTGRLTEGSRHNDLVNKPFYTDADWGGISDTSPYQGRPIGFLFQSPWLTDDNSDVEYNYINTMVNTQNPMLTDQQITDGWKNNSGDQWDLFYSNQQARTLMISRGVKSTTTGIPAANQYSHYIDAQLTTESFGALAPGRPDMGLSYALKPMLVTSRGNATHGAQYYTAMYSLASRVPDNLTSAQKVMWLNDEARKFIPNTSKVADVIDFVKADFLANPDINNWESTRDKIYQRYQAQAASHGYVYREWIESSVNTATAVMSLLYGHGDFRRTIQIATLSGWDSDCTSASLGGLLGLVFGYQNIANQFTSSEYIDRFNMVSVPLSDNFNVRFTGLKNTPDYVPAIANVEDTFTMLSNRMLPIIDKAVQQMGGTVDTANNTWTIPQLDTTDPLSLSPTQKITEKSANNKVRALGGTVTASSSATGQTSANSANLQLIADGVENNFTGVEFAPSAIDSKWYSTQSSTNSTVAEQWLAVKYSMSVWAESVSYIEGESTGTGNGNFSTMRLELFINGQWTAAPAGTTLSEALDANTPFQQFDFIFPYAMQINGMRVIGLPDSSTASVTASELDAVIIPEPSTIGLLLAGCGLLSRRRSRE